MNVLICDDEWRVTEQVSELLQKHCAENGMQVRFHLFDDPCAIKGLAGYDIAILDIDMGDFSGIDLAWRLRKEKPGIVIIFLTNFIQYAPEGFEVQAFRYLLKTNMQERLVSYFEDAVKEVVRKKTNHYDLRQFGIDRYSGKSYSLSGVKSEDRYHAPDPRRTDRISVLWKYDRFIGKVGRPWVSAYPKVLSGKYGVHRTDAV